MHELWGSPTRLSHSLRGGRAMVKGLGTSSVSMRGEGDNPRVDERALQGIAQRGVLQLAASSSVGLLDSAA